MIRVRPLLMGRAGNHKGEMGPGQRSVCAVQESPRAPPLLFLFLRGGWPPEAVAGSGGWGHGGLLEPMDGRKQAYMDVLAAGPPCPHPSGQAPEAAVAPQPAARGSHPFDPSPEKQK